MDILSSLKTVHIIGIGGSGVSGLARLLSAHGVKVTGSDMAENETIQKLRKEGVEIIIGHYIKNLDADTEAVVYSPAVPADNPELIKAQGKKIPTYSHFEFIGLLSKNYETIAISGTNGKSTTTAMVGLILETAGFDPTVLIGAVVPAWHSNVRIGRSKILVVEADEYKKKFLQLSPKHITITNIEADHLDVYGELAEIKKAFKQFIESVPEEGNVILNADDKITQELVSSRTKRGDLFYGKKGGYVILERTVSGDKRMVISLQIKGEVNELVLKIPGIMNVYNALAASALCLSLGVEFKVIKQTLEEFNGIERRFQKMGRLGKTDVISDYAHHPTSIKATIEAAREFYAGKKILTVFQPHQHHRTKIMFNELVAALAESKPDGLIVSEIFEVAGRTSTEEHISSKQLVEALILNSPPLQGGARGGLVEFSPNLITTEQKIREVEEKYDVILIMGAGDVHKVARKLVVSD